MTVESPTLPRRWTGYLAPLFAAVVGAVSYLPQMNYPFVYDDVSIIVRNRTVSGGDWSRSLTRPYWPRRLSIDPLYRPLTTLTLRINHEFSGASATGYRITNALLHSLCCALVALLAAHLWRSPWAGLVGGLLFAVHPLHAEAVSLVVGRAEILAALFILWILLRHLQHLTRGRPPSVRYDLTTALLFLLALASKEHAVFLLPAVVVLDLLFHPQVEKPEGHLPYRTYLIKSHHLCLLACLILFFLVRWLIFGARAALSEDLVDPFANPLVAAPLLTQLATPPALLWLCLRLFLWPPDLCPIWSVGGFHLPETLARFDVLAGTMLTFAVIAMTILGTIRRRLWTMPVTLAALFLILPCHFLPAANWLFAERWLYLPSAFLVVALAGLARRRGIALAAIPIAGLLFAINWQYQQNWRSTPELMTAVLDRQPGNYQALVGKLKFVALQKGSMAAHAAEVNRLHRDFPDSHWAWYFRALLCRENNEPAQVLRAVDQYLLTAPLGGISSDLLEAQQWAAQELRKPAAPE
jgi:hypothetical protein